MCIGVLPASMLCEGVRAPGIGVTDSCELSNPRSSGRAASALNHWAISPACQWTFSNMTHWSRLRQYKQTHVSSGVLLDLLIYVCLNVLCPCWKACTFNPRAQRWNEGRSSSWLAWGNSNGEDLSPRWKPRTDSWRLTSDLLHTGAVAWHLQVCTHTHTHIHTQILIAKIFP